MYAARLCPRLVRGKHCARSRRIPVVVLALGPVITGWAFCISADSGGSELRKSGGRYNRHSAAGRAAPPCSQLHCHPFFERHNALFPYPQASEEAWSASGLGDCDSNGHFAAQRARIPVEPVRPWRDLQVQRDPIQRWEACSVYALPNLRLHPASVSWAQARKELSDYPCPTQLTVTTAADPIPKRKCV